MSDLTSLHLSKDTLIAENVWLTKYVPTEYLQ